MGISISTGFNKWGPQWSPMYLQVIQSSETFPQEAEGSQDTPDNMLKSKVIGQI